MKKIYSKDEYFLLRFVRGGKLDRGEELYLATATAEMGYIIKSNNLYALKQIKHTDIPTCSFAAYGMSLFKQAIVFVNSTRGKRMSFSSKLNLNKFLQKRGYAFCKMDRAWNFFKLSLTSKEKLLDLASLFDSTNREEFLSECSRVLNHF